MECMAGYIYIWAEPRQSVNPRQVLLEVHICGFEGESMDGWLYTCAKTGYLMGARRLGILWMRKGMHAQTTASYSFQNDLAG